MTMRLLWADILRISAIFGVILLHVSAPFLVPFRQTGEWWIGNVYDSFTRWCVPLFVMVSGALLLPSADTVPLREFLLVRVRRILVPFLAWSVIYFLYRIHIKGDALRLAQFPVVLLEEPVYYHLWFVYMLIVLYLLAPPAGAFLNRAHPKHIWYLIALWCFWASLLPVIDRPFDFPLYFSPDMDDYSPLKLSGYFLLGCILRHWQTKSAWGITGLLLVFFLGGAATLFGTWLMSRAAGQFHPFFYKYFSITVVAMTVSLFLSVKSIFHTRLQSGEGRPGRFRLIPPVLQKTGMAVYGVYLIHALVLEIIRDGRFGFVIDPYSFLGTELWPAIGIPVFAASIFILSLAAVLTIRVIPVVRDLLT